MFLYVYCIKLKMCLECKQLYEKTLWKKYILKNYLYILARDVFMKKNCFHMCIL